MDEQTRLVYHSCLNSMEASREYIERVINSEPENKMKSEEDVISEINTKLGYFRAKRQSEKYDWIWSWPGYISGIILTIILLIIYFRSCS